MQYMHSAPMIPKYSIYQLVFDAAFGEWEFFFEHLRRLVARNALRGRQG